MKLVVALLLLFAVGTVVAAYVFRSRRAKGILGLILQVAYIYIAVIFAVGLYRLWQNGL